MRSTLLFIAVTLALATRSFTQDAAEKPALDSSATAETCTLQGTVFAAVSGAPLKSATVILKTGAKSFHQLTDLQGHFNFTGLPSGSYEVHAIKAGYVREGYRLDSGATNETLELKPGDKLDKVQFRLTQAGVIIGRVTDENGEPVAGTEIEAMFPPQGYVILPLDGKFAVTNDLGEYRIYDLSPGSYYVSATDSGDWEFMNLPKTRPFNFGPSNYPTLYYPGVIRGGGAQKVRVKAGEETRIDLSLRPEKLLTITGHVFDPEGKPAKDVEVLLHQEDGGVAYGRPYSSHYFADEHGKFVIERVFPGSYMVSAASSSQGKEFWAAQPIEVNGENVANVQLQLKAKLKITGKVITTGPATVDLHGMMIDTLPDEADGGTAQTENDGTFTIDKVEPTTHRLRVFLLPDGYYLRSVFFGKQNVLEDGLDLHGGVDPNEMLKVTISPGASQVDGTVLHIDQPIHNAMVILFPEPRVNREDLFRVALTDENGHFVIRSVSPGGYRLRAYPGATEGPGDEAASSDSANTAKIELTENDSKTVQLKLP